jgi:hypothetical protein
MVIYPHMDRGVAEEWSEEDKFPTVEASGFRAKW